MAAESYTLREVAEVLGVNKRTLQRRIQEGAFPGRFLAAGRHGLETRVPAAEVDQAVDELRRKNPANWRRAAGWDDGRGEGRAEPESRPSTVTPARAFESLVPYEAPDLVPAVSSSGPASGPTSALTHSDLESLRDAMLAIVREEREMFLTATREALMVRDREIIGLKQELAGLRRIMEGARAAVESLEQRVIAQRQSEARIDAQVWADVLSTTPALAPGGGVDVDALLREISELESMLVGGESD